MKRLILPLLFISFAGAVLYSFDVNIIMKDGSVIKGNMLGHTPDEMYLEQTNVQLVKLKVSEIRFAFDASTGNQIDLTSEFSSESSSTEQDQELGQGQDIVVIPDTDIYYYYYDGYDCFFYAGYWWRPWHRHWYRSGIYSGNWVLVNPGYVPYSVMHLPPRWRVGIYNAPRVGWTDLRAHWQTWNSGHYWANHNGVRNDYVRPRFIQNRPVFRQQNQGVNNTKNR